MRLFAFFLAISLSIPAIADAASASAKDADPSGYVVRTEGRKVYIDLGKKSGAAPGQGFAVYREGAVLKHPVTGAVLGKVEDTLVEGELSEVRELYSVGEFSKDAEVRIGMRVRLIPIPPPPAAAPAAPAGPGQRQPRLKSGTFEYKITGMSIADFDGDGKPETALAAKNTVSLYPYPPPAEDIPLARFPVAGTGIKILSLDSYDLNGNGKAEAFVTYYNQAFKRVETIVLELDEDNKWKPLDEIPWMVRSHQGPDGQRILAMQQLIDDTNFPFSNIYPVTLVDGRYRRAKKAIRHKRVDWLYDFTEANLDGKDPSVLYLTSTSRLRVQFKGGYWKTPESFGQTPRRIRWNGKLLHFHPPMPVAYGKEGGFEALFLIKNIAKLGGLAHPFGLYSSAEVHRKEWNGVSLSTAWKAKLGGYATGIALVDPGPGRAKDLAVTVVGTSGKSSVWIYDL